MMKTTDNSIMNDKRAKVIYGCIADLVNSGYRFIDDQRHDIAYEFDNGQTEMIISIGDTCVVSILAYRSFMSVYIEHGNKERLDSERLLLSIDRSEYNELPENEKIDLWSNKIVGYIKEVL